MTIQKFTAADGALAAALYNKYAEVEFVHKKLAEADFIDQFVTSTNRAIKINVAAKAENDEQAQKLLKPTVEQVKQLFGSKVYGVDVSSLEEVVSHLLAEKGLTLGAAESITGGLISKRMTDLPGASRVFKGGIVSYTNEVKTGLLGISEQLLAEHGAVSAPVAQAMAEGARRVLGADIALAATGVAGPDKDDRGNEVGTVFVSIATGEGSYVRALNLGNRPMRGRLRTQTAHHAFDLARRYLSGLPYEG
jgi:nicotinamide-nucleotide amidase